MHISWHRPPAVQSDLRAKLIPRLPTTFCGRRASVKGQATLLEGLLQMKQPMPSCMSLSLSTHKFAHISQCGHRRCIIYNCAVMKPSCPVQTHFRECATQCKQPNDSPAARWLHCWVLLLHRWEIAPTRGVIGLSWLWRPWPLMATLVGCLWWWNCRLDGGKMSFQPVCENFNKNWHNSC